MNRFIWYPVRSPVIAAVAYDAIDRTLAVRFKNGSLYHYFRVPRFIFDRLRTAFAPGEYFNRHIRDSYPAERIEDEQRRA